MSHPEYGDTLQAGRRPRRATIRALLTAICLALGLLMLQAPAHADVEWSVTPAGAEGPDERISLRHVIAPGATVDDHIAVRNLGDEDASFTVAVGDGVLGPDGAFDIAATEPTDSGSWITVGGLTDGSIAVPAGETRVLPVSIAVPHGATPGDHPAGIVVGLRDETDNVTVSHRVGVRVHLRVDGDIEPGLALEVLGTDYRSSWIPFAPGTLEVRYEIENVGNVRLGAGTRVEASGLFGIGSDATTATVDELLPGDTISGSVELDVPPTLLASGSIEAAGLTVGDDEVDDPGSAEEDFRALAVPWTGLALLGLIVAALLIRRRRHRQEPTPGDPDDTPSTPDLVRTFD
ncbi:hypothetical protein [uncultured Aeromicrobium sp.]|uniref:hypothetical protein n=1 Tax=uncultured Aeromicrobium sp. TaxID=337820 RepID=UPI0025DEBC1D|nr:hypothetical protein [uncultured Aeromicrobium sp.]